MHPFQKLLEKKMKMGDMLKPEEKDAHKAALLGLKKDADGTIADKLKGLKKVTVASDSDKGLEEGLGLASELAEDKADHGMDEDKEGIHALMTDKRNPALEHDLGGMDSLETIDEQIAHLLKKREHLKHK